MLQMIDMQLVAISNHATTSDVVCIQWLARTTHLRTNLVTATWHDMHLVTNCAHKTRQATE